jgi:signal transduction histidine kinase
VLVNLLSNAIKYTPEGGRVSVRAEKLEPKCGGRNRRIVVEDSGIGMSADFMPHLFEPFSQENRPEAGGVGGTGLGLSIVKRIVDLMGGVIDVKSEPGKGTRFTIDLPVPAENSRRGPAGQGRKTGGPLCGRKLLLCEDNPLNTEIAVILLRGRGRSPWTAP